MSDFSKVRRINRNGVGLCRCGKQAKIRKGVIGKRCEDCLKSNKIRKDTNKAAGKCYNCSDRYAVEGKTCCQYCINYYKNKRMMYKRNVIDIYGGKCTCCGENHLSMLEIDHINNDGCEERKKVGSIWGSGYQYKKLLDLPKRDDLQILCSNCNLSKAILGECEHRIINI